MLENMPQLVEKAVYDELTQQEKETIEAETPIVFPNAETAIHWGYEKGAFSTIEVSRRCYEALKLAKRPKTAQEMATLWATEICGRKQSNQEAKSQTVG